MRFNARLIRHASWLLLLAAGAIRCETAIQLTLKPNKCIALHKGQSCYQTINFYWRTPATGEFCLLAQGQDQPLHCWQGEGAPPFRYEFVGQHSLHFFLRTQGAQLVDTEFTVAWVYSSGKRDTGGWRLF